MRICSIIVRNLPVFGQALLLAASGAAQDSAPAVTFRADSSLALLSFHVMRGDAFVDDLRPGDIEILEDGVPRKVAVFEGGRHFPRTIPLELILLFDCSGSVQEARLLNARVFEAALFRKHPQVTMSVYGFTHTWHKFAAPTRDIELLNRAAEEVMGTTPGGTRLYEAVRQTLRDATAGKRQATRTLVIFSDSVAPADAEPEAIGAARGAGVAVYPVILGPPLHGLMDAARPRPAFINPFDKTIANFARLAAETGGHEFRHATASPAALSEILEWILGQLSAEYVAGYYAAAVESVRPRQAQVILRDSERGQIHGGVRTLTH